MNGTTLDHGKYIEAVRDLMIARGIESGRVTDEEATAMRAVKLLYGTGLGMRGTRGVTAFSTWKNGGDDSVATVEIMAAAQESWLQLACTTVHEFAHVVAGPDAGHDGTWKAYADRLGLRRAKAAGMRYSLAALDPILRERVYALATRLSDGSPDFMGHGRASATLGPRPCSAGIGTRGGTSRGTGSGSRLLKVACGECGYVARVTGTWIASHGAPHCGTLEHGRMTVA